MGYWGKVLGGMAGFAMGGPFGAAIGAALGHAADAGMGQGFSFPFSPTANSVAGQAKVAALLGQKQQLFSIAVVALAAAPVAGLVVVLAFVLGRASVERSR